MLLAAFCDACHRPLFQEAVNVQVQSGELLVSTSGVQMRNNQSPESYNFCQSCASAVRGVIAQVLQQRGVQARQQAQPQSAPSAERRSA